MVENLWSMVRLFCGNHHEKPCQMLPHNAPSGKMAQSLYGSSLNMFYSCPKYYPENRAPEEKCCRNHISMNEFEKMLAHISDALAKYEETGGTVNLTGEKWKSRQGVIYEIVRHDEKHIDVMCLNKKNLWS